MSSVQSRPMLAPETIKSFRVKFEKIRRTYATASVYLQFEEQHQESAEGLKKCWLAAYECGSELKEVHDSKSYVENYATWGEMLEELHISRTHADRLMKCAVILGTLPRELIGQLGMPLSFREVESLGKIPVEERVEIIEEAVNASADASNEESNQATSPENGDAAFTKLRERLRSSSVPTKMVDAVADSKKSGKVKDSKWARKQAERLLEWFTAQSDDEGVGYMEVVVKHLEPQPNALP